MKKRNVLTYWNTGIMSHEIAQRAGKQKPLNPDTHHRPKQPACLNHFSGVKIVSVSGVARPGCCCHCHFTSTKKNLTCCPVWTGTWFSSGSFHFNTTSWPASSSSSVDSGTVISSWPVSYVRPGNTKSEPSLDVGRPISCYQSLEKNLTDFRPEPMFWHPVRQKLGPSKTLKMLVHVQKRSQVHC